MSFLEKLRKGVANIETEVKKLKELTEEADICDEDQIKDNLMKAKSFETEVRQTYAEVSQVLNAIKSSGDLLDESKNRILSLKQRLCNLEDNSGLKKFGYKPFQEQYSIDTIDDNVFADDITKEEEKDCVDKTVENHSSGEKTLSAKHLAKEFAKKTDLNEERTTQTLRFAPDMPVVKNRDGSNDRPKVETKRPENKRQISTKKYDKLLARTPQRVDFGITRRLTLHSQLFNNNNKPDVNTTPEIPASDMTQTCRFNYINNNGFQLGSAVNPLTPPNQSHNNNNGGDSFVTVEFTPGLTTKRPKGISRVQNNDSNNGNNNNMNINKTSKDSNKEKETKKWSNTQTENKYTQRLPQSILQSVENDKVTPEQPIPTSDLTKSKHILRSIAGKSSGTPPLPKSRIDANFHNQILKHL